MHFSNGNSVSPAVQANFNCLQTSGDFCQQTPLGLPQLALQLSVLTQLLQQVQLQQKNLSSQLQAQVQPWVLQLQQMQQQLVGQLKTQNK